MNSEENSSLTTSSPTNSPAEEKKTTWKEVVKEIVIFAIIAFGIVLPFRLFIAEPYLVDGRSMDPTFATGDYLIVDKLSYELGTPKRNTVVVFKYPNDTSKSFIKRIIGLPGETVEENGNAVTIINKDNPKGFTIDESYVVHEAPGNFKITLGDDEYFVMGDNRAESFDSRSWGPLQEKYILGKPVLRLWPLSELGFLPGNDKK
jgi:signal peptidase I